jgi:hypothetical protein
VPPPAPPTGFGPTGFKPGPGSAVPPPPNYTVNTSPPAGAKPATAGTSIRAIIAGILPSNLLGPFGHIVSAATNHVAPVEWPGFSAVAGLYVSGLFSAPEADLGIRMDGKLTRLERYPFPVTWAYENGLLEKRAEADLQFGFPWTQLVHDQFWKPDINGTMNLLKRGHIGENLARYFLRRSGVATDAEATLHLAMRNEIPAAGSILDMSVRGALDSSTERFQVLQEEFDPLFQFWVNALGIGPVTLPVRDTPGATETLDFAQALWATHWQLPSVGLLNQMKIRLRPTGGKNNGPRDPSGLVVDEDILDSGYRQNSVHPAWRRAFSAVAHPPIGIRHARILLDTRTIDAAGFKEVMLDAGFNDRDAQLITDANIKASNDRLRKAAESQARSSYASAWELGTIDDAQYRQLLSAHGLFPDEVETAVQLALVQDQERYARRIVTTLRGQYLRGKISAGEASAKLGQVGIMPARVARYLATWSVEKEGVYPEIAASKLLKFAEQGLIPIGEVIRRLGNLGYQAADIDLLVSDLTYQLAARQAKALQKLAKAQKQLEADAERALRAADAATRKIRSDLARHGTPSKLKTWLCDGLIGEPEARERLHVLGWPDADIDRLFAECTVKKPSTKPPKGSTGGSSGAQSGQTQNAPTTPSA